jgi:DeoR family fructose operon transcriptional repressor
VDDEERMAKAALAEVPADGTILLDAGTVLTCFAEDLPRGRELTVLTNSAGTAASLSTRTELTVLVLGGRVRRHTLTAVDEWALQMLRQMFVDVAFIGTGGLSIHGGLTTSDGAEALFKRTVISAARRTVVLTAPGAIGADQPVAFGTLDDVDTVITGSGIDPATVQRIAAAGPRVVLA